MGSTMNVNGKTVVHAGSGGKAAAFPDSCKTPTPGGPQPMPYPNVAMSSDASDVTTTVKVDGNGICVDGSKFAISTGDEAGTLLGVTSNKIKGSASFTNFSTDVKADGKAVARLSDPMQQNEGTANTSTPAELQGPLVVLDASKLAKTQEEACAAMAKNEVTDHAKGAADAGMLRQDYEAIRRTCKANKVTCSFRDTNPACLPHLKAGVESKGHDVLTKTFPAENLKPEDRALAGKVSTLKAKLPPGEIIPDPKSKLHDKPTELTGDYDMMDMLDASGKRIPGESDRDHAIRKKLNDAIPPNDDGKQHDRIKHGCQAEYGNYLRTHNEHAQSEAAKKNNAEVEQWRDDGKITDAEAKSMMIEPEPAIKSLYKPEAPITVFDKDGKVYRLNSNEDVANFYKCKGCGMPPEWNVAKTERFGDGASKLTRVT